MPKTPRNDKSAGAGKPAGGKQGSFAIIGKISKRLLGRKYGWEGPEHSGGSGRFK